MRFHMLGILAAMLLVLGSPTGLRAQDVGVVQSEILVLDPDRLISETIFGKRLSADYQDRRDKLIARNRQLETELEAEEQALTDLRAEKTPEEFKKLADEFDTKVQRIRRDSDRAVRDLELSRERSPVVFMRTVEPVLIELMSDAGGSVLLDVRSVMLSANVIDITDIAISRIDHQIGEGPAEIDLLPQATGQDPAPDETGQE